MDINEIKKNILNAETPFQLVNVLDYNKKKYNQFDRKTWEQLVNSLPLKDKERVISWVKIGRQRPLAYPRCCEGKEVIEYEEYVLNIKYYRESLGMSINDLKSKAEARYHKPFKEIIMDDMSAIDLLWWLELKFLKKVKL